MDEEQLMQMSLLRLHLQYLSEWYGRGLTAMEAASDIAVPWLKWCQKMCEGEVQLRI